MSATPLISRIDLGRGPRIKNLDRFKTPPRIGAWKLWRLSQAATRAGRRDGRAGVPAAEDMALPTMLRRLVEEGNGFMRERVAHRYLLERSRLVDLQNHMEAAANERKAQIESLQALLPDDAPAIATDASLKTPGETSEDEAPPAGDPLVKTAEPSKRAEAASSDRPLRAQSHLSYFLALALIFTGEAIVNKKAFELFSETDRILWLMVSGVAVAIVVAAHLLGKFWKRFAQDGSDRAPLIILGLVALVGAVMLGSMRYLAVDNERQDQVTLLEGQRQAATAELQRNLSSQAQLEARPSLSPRETEELRLARSRIASAEALIRATDARLASTQKLSGIDNPAIAIPLYVLLNILLIGVASALSYHHADPEAEEAAAFRRRTRRDRFYGWLISVWSGISARRADQRRLKDEARAREEAETARQRMNELNSDRRAKIATLQREVGHLRAGYKTAENTLEEMRKAYCGALEATESTYRGIAERYWAAQNHTARQPAQELRDAWEKGRRRALKKGLAPTEKPEDIEWRQPAVQQVALPFTRPAEVGC